MPDVSSFLAEFALAGSEGGLTRINAASGQFEHVILCGITILTFEEYSRFACGVVDRQDDHRS
jgi:hypothetical protein